MSEDLGPFAIRRIERRRVAGAPATALVDQAAEAFIARAKGDLVRGTEEDAQVTAAIASRSGAIASANLTPLLNDQPAQPPDGSTAVSPPSHDPLKPLLGDFLPPESR